MHRRSESLDPARVCALRCSRAVSVGSSGIPWECLWCSLCCIAAALWNIHSSKNWLHSCLQMVFHPGHSFFISSRNNWDWRAQSATHFGKPVFLVKLLCMFSQYWKIAMEQSNQLLHSVTNNLCLSNSNSSLRKWAKSTHFWTHNRQITLISQLWGSCISQLI